MRPSLSALLLLLAGPAAAEEPAPPASQAQAAASPSPATENAGAARAQDFVETEEGRIELLRPRPISGEVRTPEGYLRIEGPPEEEAGRPGSFAILRAPALALTSRATDAAAEDEAEEPPEPGPRLAATDPCAAEREAYVRELMRASGIEDIDRPLLLLDALVGPGTARTVGYGLLPWPWGGWLPDAPSIRPLAWDSTLRLRARELTRCAAVNR
jgi:hypothetical protein